MQTEVIIKLFTTQKHNYKIFKSEPTSLVSIQLFYLPIGESNGLNGADEGDDEVEDHLEESSRDFVNARLQLDQGMIGVNASRNLINMFKKIEPNYSCCIYYLLGHANPYRYNYIGGIQGQQQLNSISSPGVSFPAVSGHEDIMFAPKW